VKSSSFVSLGLGLVQAVVGVISRRSIPASASCLDIFTLRSSAARLPPLRQVRSTLLWLSFELPIVLGLFTSPARLLWLATGQEYLETPYIGITLNTKLDCCTT
jgi:hypothetical protein